MITKENLVSQLENAKNNYLLGLAAISLFSNEKVHRTLEESHASFGQYTVQFEQISTLLSESADREIALKEFLKSQIRALIKESFELIKDYCEQTGQVEAFKAEPWYQFARVIRNCLSHSYRFKFNLHDKKVLPISWKTKTIDSSLDGQHLKLEFFGFPETWELFIEYQSFVNDRAS